jgi:SagB-type dehydrogenase family enzyme
MRFRSQRAQVPVLPGAASWHALSSIQLPLALFGAAQRGIASPDFCTAELRGLPMTNVSRDPLLSVFEYHERTKHQFDRPAASLGYMDWATQPDPFRAFSDAPTVDLRRPELRAQPTYDSLFLTGDRPVAHPHALDADSVGRLFYHSLALSAWKKARWTQPWSLRINPSSGALHPTEGYLICGVVSDLLDTPGVYHYVPFFHRLERRVSFTPEQYAKLVDGFPEPCVLIGLSSIYWRESWKYGERAFRYCHHDVGHALGCFAFAARTMGWRVRVLNSIPGADLNRLLATDAQSGPEAEHADCLLLISPEEDVDRAAPAVDAENIDIRPSDSWSDRIPTATPARISQPTQQRTPRLAHHRRGLAGDDAHSGCRPANRRGPHGKPRPRGCSRR